MGLNYGLLAAAIAGIAGLEAYKSHQQLGAENDYIDQQNEQMQKQGMPSQYMLAHIPGFFAHGDSKDQMALVDQAVQNQQHQYQLNDFNQNYLPQGMQAFKTYDEAKPFMSKFLEDQGQNYAGYEHGRNVLGAYQVVPGYIQSNLSGTYTPPSTAPTASQVQPQPAQPGQNATPAPAGAPTQATPAQNSDLLSPLETASLGQTYQGEDPGSRVARLETAIYGNPKNGPIAPRMQQLSKDLNIPLTPPQPTLTAKAQAAPPPQLPPELQGVNVTPQDIKDIQDGMMRNRELGINQQNATTNEKRYGLEEKKYNTVELPKEQRDEQLFAGQKEHQSLENQYTQQQISDMRQNFFEAKKENPLKYQKLVAETAEAQAKANGTTFINELNALQKANLITNEDRVQAAKIHAGILPKPTAKTPQPKTLPAATPNQIDNLVSMISTLENQLKNTKDPNEVQKINQKIRLNQAQLDRITPGVNTNSTTPTSNPAPQQTKNGPKLRVYGGKYKVSF